MLRNLVSTNTLPCSPTRSCRYRIGWPEPDSIRIASATISMNGHVSASTIKAVDTSNTRLTTRRNGEESKPSENTSHDGSISDNLTLPDSRSKNVARSVTAIPACLQSSNSSIGRPARRSSGPTTISLICRRRAHTSNEPSKTSKRSSGTAIVSAPMRTKPTIVKPRRSARRRIHRGIRAALSPAPRIRTRRLRDSTSIRRMNTTRNATTKTNPNAMARPNTLRPM